MNETETDIDQEVLLAIEKIVGDDFCADLEAKMKFHPERLTPTEVICTEKLLSVFELAHSYVRQHPCYHVHQNWRDKLNPEKPSVKSQT